MHILDSPVAVFVVTFAVLWLSAWFGKFLRGGHSPLGEQEHEDLGVIIAGALTLLGLIIGFAFSMAVTRYDQRKNYEEEEANAIGTEYLRVNLLPAEFSARLHDTLRAYLVQRMAFYETRNPTTRRRIAAETSRLQSELWSSVESAARTNPTPTVALVVYGMNEVLNRQGYTQAAWWNRIPLAAWGLMLAIAIACNVLLGYAAHQTEGRMRRYYVFPLIVAISFFLIADIDSPLGGIIRVHPQNLEALAQSLNS